MADLVLTDDNFATIVAAVEEGRAVFDNIRKFLYYLLSSNAGEVLTVFFAVVLAGPLGLDHHGILVLPLPATQTLWINLLTDGAPALALGVDPPDPDLMSHSPRPHGEGVIDRRMRVDIALVGIVMAAGTLLIFDAALPGGFIEGGRRNGIRSDNGIYDVDALSTVQCLQRPIGGAQRLPGPVP